MLYPLGIEDVWVLREKLNGGSHVKTSIMIVNVHYHQDIIDS